MKKFKKLIPALCMLLVSAVMLGTTTFAWFSMNNKVAANNMSVTAKSNSTYLQISKTSASATDFADAAEMNSTKTVYPCAFTTAAMDADTDKNNAAIAANNFYTANNTKADGKGDVINRKAVTMADGEYLSAQKVYLKLTADSENYTGKLKLSFTKVSGHDSVKAVVKVGTEYVALDVNTNEGTFNSDVTITSTQALEVTIYVYIDGTNENVISDYINAEATKNSLTGAINIGFEIVVG